MGRDLSGALSGGFLAVIDKAPHIDEPDTMSKEGVMTRIQTAAVGLATIVCTSTFLTLATPVSAGQGEAKGHAKQAEKHEDHAEKHEQKAHKASAKTKGSTDDEGTRFPGVDRDHDGVIRRAEWRGSDASFASHDWNRDGVLSGKEMIPGAVRPAPARSASRQPAAAPAPIPAAPRATPRPSSAPDPDGPVFARLDANHDGVLTRVEWPDERFSRVDFNHDGVLSAYEYGVGR
jgi:hypothetical protein